MTRRLKQILSGATRRLAALPLKCLFPDLRAQVLERETQNMISTTPVPRGSIRFFAPSPLLRSRAIGVLSKEADTIRWIDGFAKGSVFWDIGANVGVYSLYAAVSNNDIRVLSFEPSAANFHVLSRNVQLNALSQRVTAYCLAFSDRTQLGILNMASPQMGGALSQFGQHGEMSRYSDPNASCATHGMIGLGIDQFISQFEPPFPNYLKLDVDGLELCILNGATETLRDPRLRSLMVELSLTNEAERGEALALLEASGWRLIARGESQGANFESAANHFFERSIVPVQVA